MPAEELLHGHEIERLRGAAAAAAAWLRRFGNRLALLSLVFWLGYLSAAGLLRLPMAEPDFQPDWVSGFADALCNYDAQRVAQYVGGPKFERMGEADIARTFDGWRNSGASCGGARYLGALTNANGQRQYVYALAMRTTVGEGELWYVFTVAGGKIVDIQ